MKQVKAYGTDGADLPLQEMSILRRDPQEHDVAFDILFCGICHSDLHSIHNDWGGTKYPVVPGHEILGRVTSVGAAVKDFKIGDLVAVGCIVDSCRHCNYCLEGEEQFCENGVIFSYNSPDKISGGLTYGGFSKSYVCDEKYVLHMPAFSNLAAAAPLLCAGITVYSPLKHWKAGPGKSIGILGIGGLGHVAIKIAKAMGAEVIVFTSSPAKIDDAKKMGADHAIITQNIDEIKLWKGKIDFIIDTISAKHDVNIYLDLLRPDGAMVLVGLPNEPLEIAPFAVVHGRRSFSGSNIGGIKETQEMLDFCYKHQITADIELIKPGYLNNAFARLAKNNVKYRFVIDLE